MREVSLCVCFLIVFLIHLSNGEPAMSCTCNGETCVCNIPSKCTCDGTTCYCVPIDEPREYGEKKNITCTNDEQCGHGTCVFKNEVNETKNDANETNLQNAIQEGTCKCKSQYATLHVKKPCGYERKSLNILRVLTYIPFLSSTGAPWFYMSDDLETTNTQRGYCFMGVLTFFIGLPFWICVLTMCCTCGMALLFWMGVGENGSSSVPLYTKILLFTIICSIIIWLSLTIAVSTDSFPDSNGILPA